MLILTKSSLLSSSERVAMCFSRLVGAAFSAGAFAVTGLRRAMVELTSVSKQVGAEGN